MIDRGPLTIEYFYTILRPGAIGRLTTLQPQWLPFIKKIEEVERYVVGNAGGVYISPHDEALVEAADRSAIVPTDLAEALLAVSLATFRVNPARRSVRDALPEGAVPSPHDAGFVSVPVLQAYRWFGWAPLWEAYEFGSCPVPITSEVTKAVGALAAEAEQDR